MRLRPDHEIAIWLTLIACVLVALLPAGGLAVCLGDDGHVGVGQPGIETMCCACVPATGDHDAGCMDLELEAPHVCARNPEPGCTLVVPVYALAPAPYVRRTPVQPAAYVGQGQALLQKRISVLLI